MRKFWNAKFLQAESQGREFTLPTMTNMPTLRYTPSRHMVQRLVRRATILPDEGYEFQFRDSTNIINYKQSPLHLTRRATTYAEENQAISNEKH